MSIGLLSDVLESFEVIDANDSYQVFALYSLIDCECSKCDERIEFPTTIDDSSTRQWAAEVAGFLRDAGWFIPDRQGDSYDFNCLCPSCAQKHKRLPPPTAGR